MIDPLKEELISLNQARRLFPRNARGKRPDLATLYRYTTSGCRGVILASAQCGARRCTSRQAVARFFEQLTKKRNSGSTHFSNDKDSQLAVSDHQVKLELDRAGIK